MTLRPSRVEGLVHQPGSWTPKPAVASAGAACSRKRCAPAVSRSDLRGGRCGGRHRAPGRAGRPCPARPGTSPAVPRADGPVPAGCPGPPRPPRLRPPSSARHRPGARAARSRSSLSSRRLGQSEEGAHRSGESVGLPGRDRLGEGGRVGTVEAFDLAVRAGEGAQPRPEGRRAAPTDRQPGRAQCGAGGGIGDVVEQVGPVAGLRWVVPVGCRDERRRGSGGQDRAHEASAPTRTGCHRARAGSGSRVGSSRPRPTRSAAKSSTSFRCWTDGPAVWSIRSRRSWDRNQAYAASLSMIRTGTRQAPAALSPEEVVIVSRTSSGDGWGPSAVPGSGSASVPVVPAVDGEAEDVGQLVDADGVRMVLHSWSAAASSRSRRRPRGVLTPQRPARRLDRRRGEPAGVQDVQGNSLGGQLGTNPYRRQYPSRISRSGRSPAA